MRKNFWLQACDFCKRLTLQEAVKGCLVVCFFAYFFYRSLWSLPFLVPIGILFVEWGRRKNQQKQNLDYLEQFKECILSVEASLRAGYAVENAFLESRKDMQMMFGDNCLICMQLAWIEKGLQNNETLEKLLSVVAEDCQNEEFLEFAEVFAIAKRNSGKLSGTIEVYSTMIAEKLEALREMQTSLAAKRLEQSVMNVMPFAIVLYLNFSNPGYFDMLFHNVSGIFIMTGCMGAYIFAFAWAESIFMKLYG